MFTERTSVGLDVHARSVVAAALDTTMGVTTTARLSPSPSEVLAWVRTQPGPAAVCDEAGPTGYQLARTFTAAGVRCVVAAPSKIVRPAGNRVKTDAKDAQLLARLLRMDQLSAVRVPTEAEEAARDLVRAREDARSALMAARHRLSKLLLHHGYVYSGGVAWTVTESHAVVGFDPSSTGIVPYDSDSAAAEPGHEVRSLPIAARRTSPGRGWANAWLWILRARGAGCRPWMAPTGDPQ